MGPIQQIHAEWGTMRLTEDPAGLPYKLSSRWMNQAIEQVNE
jgi:hypothetical protein